MYSAGQNAGFSFIKVKGLCYTIMFNGDNTKLFFGENFPTFIEENYTQPGDSMTHLHTKMIFDGQQIASGQSTIPFDEGLFVASTGELSAEGKSKLERLIAWCLYDIVVSGKATLKTVSS
jgi:hypothetical protein